MRRVSTDSAEAFVIRVGTIVDVAPLKKNKRGWLLAIDFGPGVGIMSSVALVGDSYAADALLGRDVRAVVNLPPRRVDGVLSEALLLGFPDEDDRPVLAGADVPGPKNRC